MEFYRSFDFYSVLKKKSLFLLGARSTGKTYWIKKRLPKNALYISLLETETLLRLSDQPGLLKKMIGSKKLVVIDEIQKIPDLLNEVHILIEESNIHFLLTGSSARKLKGTSANMLGGRALNQSFFPLTSNEIPKFNLNRYLTIGGLPRVYKSEDPQLELSAYVSSYLDLEVKAESLVRNLIPFHRFIKTAALTNGELINYANIANDAAVPASTVKEYFSVLEDTLIGFVLEPWTESKKRKAIQTSKFYFFDTGVCNKILGVEKLQKSSNLWGKAFEQFIAMELKAFLSYNLKPQKLTFWRNESKQEVDFLIGEDVAIEVKSSHRISRKHFSGIKALQEEKVFKKYFIISEDPIDREENRATVMYWERFLKLLWAGEII